MIYLAPVLAAVLGIIFGIMLAVLFFRKYRGLVIVFHNDDDCSWMVRE